MDERRYNQKLPWDEGIYGTGRTRPPKSRGGIIAFLLILVILLSGIVGILGVLNVKLFTELNNQNHQELPMSFTNQQTTEPSTGAPGLTKATEPADTDNSPISLDPTPQSSENIPLEGALSWQEVYEKNISSVVSIACTTLSGSSSGTGVVITADGYIVTNCHVVEDAQSITVRLTNGKNYPALLVGADQVSDLAVLFIEAEGLTAARFGDSDALRVGDAVVAIGDPLGIQFHGSMTDGIISAINRDITVSGRTMTLIQTNAALNSGNSGGPLINCYGQVIGINTMKISTFVDEAGVEGLGFAIPSTTVKTIVEQLISQGYVSGRPTLGLEGEEISSFYQHYYRMPAGLYITHVDEDSDADTKGVDKGDILISIDGTRITNMDIMNTVLYAHEVGDTVNVIIYRGGKQYALTLTLTEDKG